MSQPSSPERRLLRILVTPLNGHGHINACHGLCEELRDRGHKIIFLVDSDFAGRLVKYGFEERHITRPPMPNADDMEGKEFWQYFIAKNAHRFAQPPSVQIKDILPEIFSVMFNGQNALAEQYQKAIEEIKPDLIIHDGYVCFPTIVNSNKPWVWLYSAAPHLMLMDPRIPPFFSSLPLDSDRNEWKKFDEETSKSLGPILKEISDYNVSQGGKPLNGRLHPFSDFLNIYMMPQEMRYKELADLPKNIMAVDCFVRTVPDQKFDIPEQLRNRPGKLVFFSMGSFGCANLSLMTRLVAMLAKSKHRFIVAKGPLDYELPGDNLYGEPFVPQTALLPQVDLVITHGGNNTVTETFYYGKPMIVMSTFCDQHDNAQRIAEVGLGAKLNPFTCTEQELLDTIDRMLADQQLAQRMAKIGERIRSSNDKKIVADLIESKLK